MNISPELAGYIINYGYLAIFFIVFLQEIGVPNPVATEVIILFAGYLAYLGRLNLFLLLLTVVAADFLGTSILYAIFYHFGKKLFDKMPRWMPIEKINRLKEKILRQGRKGVYLGRMLPYVRGYASVAAGLLRIPPKIFLPAVLLSAITWSGSYAVAGVLLGPAWQNLITKFGLGKFLIVFLAAVILIFYVWPRISKSLGKKEKVNP